MVKYPIFVKGFDGRSLCLCAEPSWGIIDIKRRIQEVTAIPAAQQILAGPKCLANEDAAANSSLEKLGIEANSTLHLTGRLRGGKGGFGSLLRGSAKATATDNEDAYRDLSGRRLRVVNAEKKLKDWQSSERQRKAQIIAAKEQKQQQKSEKRKNLTEEQLDEIRKEQSSVADSLARAIRSSKATSSKRVADGLPEQPSKKKRFRGDSEDEDSEGDSDLGDSDSEQDISIVPSKVTKHVEGTQQQHQVIGKADAIKQPATVDRQSVGTPEMGIIVN